MAKHKTAGFRAVLALFFLVSAFFLFAACGQAGSPEETPYKANEMETETGEAGQDEGIEQTGAAAASKELSVKDVAKQLTPSVVGIATTKAAAGSTGTINGVGSGFIVSGDGYILTNAHVAGEVTEITVILENGDKLKGETLWSDSSVDLAVVKVDAVNLPAVTLGSTRELAVGETVVAIGTPLSLQFQHTVTSGIVSALNRVLAVSADGSENVMEGLVQTDASINAGNSGGPLINARGQVVGINTVKVSSAEGMGFAIPIDLAKPIIESFIQNGSFTTPYIGVVGYDKKMAQFYMNTENLSEGIFVAGLDQNGPAYAAGLRENDIIVSFNGEDVTTMTELKQAMYGCPIGSTVKLTALRQGGSMQFDITVSTK